MWLAFCFIFVYYLLYLEFEPFVSRSILSVLDAFLFGVRVPVSFSDDERCLFFIPAILLILLIMYARYQKKKRERQRRQRKKAVNICLICLRNLIRSLLKDCTLITSDVLFVR